MLRPLPLGRLFLLLLLAWQTGFHLGFATPLLADTWAPPALTLHSLKIVGARIVPAKKIREELTIPLPSRWPWKEPPIFKSGDLEGDVQQLLVFYRRRGFYHTRITPEVHISDTGRVDVVLTIDEGPWVQVTGVEVEDTSVIPPGVLAELRDKSPLKPGDRFTEEGYEALKRQYLSYLLDHGYPRARVGGQVSLDEELNTAALKVGITPGSLCYFGEASVKGELETPDYVILRKLTFQKGEIFSFQEIYNSQRRIFALDLFETVTITPGEVPEGDRHIPVVVEVRERVKKRSIKLGLGYGDFDRIRARVGLRWRNVGGGGRLLDLDAKYSFIESRVMGTFTNPQVFTSRLDLVAQGGFIRRDLPGFTDKAVFSQVRLERDLPWHLRGYVGHSLEFARPFNVPVQTVILLGERETERLYRASMATLGLRRDTTDNEVDPSRGGLLTATGEVAPDFLGSNLQFARTALEARRYQAIGGRTFVMAGRLKLGLIEPIQSTSQIPIFRRFFCGGALSVRGYRLDYLGPRNLSGDPIGGEALVEGSLEARIPIYKEFRAVAFLDFGNVYLKIRNIDLGQLKYSSGFGLRYVTPIGPVGVDIGFPLNPIDPARDDYQVHFTIGQAF